MAPGHFWWAWMELNHRPHAYQACALTRLSYRPVQDTGNQIQETRLFPAKILYSAKPRPDLPSRYQIPIPKKLYFLVSCLWFLVSCSLDLSKLDRNVSSGSLFFLRKEVIQPQVPLRLPCYDFTPIISHTLGACPPCGLARQLLVQPTLMV